jgi:hypothetical protein
MSGEELESSRIEEVASLENGRPYTIDLIDEHLATTGTHDVEIEWRFHGIEMDLYTDRYFCRVCDVWIEPPCECKEGEGCPFPVQPSRPSLSTGTKEKVGLKTLEGMRARTRRVRENKDVCEKCHGEKGGTPGNENIVNGRVLCDYCTAEEMP